MKTVKAEDVRKAVQTGDRIGVTAGKVTVGLAAIVGGGLASAMWGFAKGGFEICKELMPPAVEQEATTEMIPEAKKEEESKIVLAK